MTHNQPAVIDHDRLSQITFLASGSHPSFEAGVCAMEAAAYVAGEPFSDHPKCVSPVIGAFMRAWKELQASAAQLVIRMCEAA